MAEKYWVVLFDNSKGEEIKRSNFPHALQHAKAIGAVWEMGLSNRNDHAVILVLAVDDQSEEAVMQRRRR